MMKIVHTALAYEREREIGSGFFGTVYLANDPQLGGHVAIKEIPKAAFGGGVDEFFREAQAMYASESQNVVPIRYASAATDHVCLAMPYFENGSLKKKIENGPLPFADVVHISDGLLNGLAQIHNVANRIHFDVKPSNVLFSDRGDAMVADFGQARIIAKSGLAPFPPIYYLGQPPESFSTPHGSVECDVYQAGLTLYRAINGDPNWASQIPARGDLQTAITKGRFPDRRAFMPHVPHSFRRVVRKAISVKPSQRYSSATAFAKAINNVRVRYHWQTQLLPDDEIQWDGSDGYHAPLVFTLTRNAGDGWDVKCFTASTLGHRKRGESSIWRTNVGRIAALQHLDSQFAQLERD